MKARASNLRTKKIGSVAAVADRAEAASGRTPRAEASTPCAALQTQIDRSPRMLTQRRAMQSALGSTSSREADRCTEVPRDRVDGAPVRQASMVHGGVLPAASSVDVGPAVSAASAAPAQVDEAKPNRTGLPNQLKAGIERLSGMDMSAVRVHRNSDKPAQLSALAYAQGNHIHLRSGQEQHLPHEAWHVVQQRQGRVRATTQIAGTGVNDQAGLEREADVMGAKAISQGGGTSAASKSRNSASGSVRRQTHPSAASAIQMAGHAEDLCFVGRWLVKRADKTEINQYTKKEIPDNAPNFDGPFYSAADVLAALKTSGENVTQEAQDKINLMAETMKPNGKGFMLLENAKVGMTSPEMRDLKMGIHTASGTDQERHDVTGLAKVTKILRHDIMDYISDSSSRGYRDEDRWQLSKLGDNTDELKRMLNRASMSALNGIERDLARFRGWLEKTSVVYVGMSLLVLAGGDQGKAVAIDFEHPIRKDDRSFIEHRDGILLGMGHLHQMVAEFRGTFAERTRRKEIERDRRAEEFRKEQLGALAAPVGSINYSSQYGRKDIGNEDL